MELIVKLLSRLNKTGHLQSWGKFLCPFCLQEVEKLLWNGLKSKSCGCKKVELSSYGNKGKKRTEEHKQKISLANKGKKRTDEQKINYSNAQLGHEVSYKTRVKLSSYNKGRKKSKETKQKMMGNKNPSWNNGSSFEPYSPEFNKILKNQILERDNYTCQNSICNIKHKKLHIHHIDYNKKNNNPKNLITLGVSCHSKTNFNRQYWSEFYQNIMKAKV